MVVLKSRIENTNRGISLRETIRNLSYQKLDKCLHGQQAVVNSTLLTREIRTVTVVLNVTRIDCHSKTNTGMSLPKGREYDQEKRKKTNLGGHLYIISVQMKEKLVKETGEKEI